MQRFYFSFIGILFSTLLFNNVAVAMKVAVKIDNQGPALSKGVLRVSATTEARNISDRIDVDVAANSEKEFQVDLAGLKNSEKLAGGTLTVTLFDAQGHDLAEVRNHETVSACQLNPLSLKIDLSKKTFDLLIPKSGSDWIQGSVTEERAAH